MKLSGADEIQILATYTYRMTVYRGDLSYDEPKLLTNDEVAEKMTRIGWAGDTTGPEIAISFAAAVPTPEPVILFDAVGEAGLQWTCQDCGATSGPFFSDPDRHEDDARRHVCEDAS
jgi:hypothetical protein